MDSNTVSNIICIIFYVAYIVGLWKTFEKANEAGWKSLIPFYNWYILFKIGWGNGWLFLLMLIPIVDIVVDIILSLKLAKAYGKGIVYGLGLIFLPSVFFIIMGFDKNLTYIGPNGEAKNPEPEKAE